MALPLRVFFSCSGVSIINRGIESFFREAFDGLREVEGLDLTLFKGAGNVKTDERVLWNLARTKRTAQWLGKLIGRNGYVVEQLSTFPSMIQAIRKHRPDIIFYSDSNLGFQLYRWRKQIGVPFRMLFSNGGPCHAPFVRTDYVHQVAPQYYNEAIVAGEPPERHRMVPYGIGVPEGAPDRDSEARLALRRKLGLPTDRKIVLSVGWISATQKRMDYLIKEVGMLKWKGEKERPYLVMLGAMDAESEKVVTLAREKLGVENFVARSVSYEEVANYYRAADLFALASLQEGFGRVFLEALMHGLPVIGHDHPVMRFVLGCEGTFGDLSKGGELAGLIDSQLHRQETAEDAARRRESVRQRFSWPVLAPQYRDMFIDCWRKGPRTTDH
ncbi:MAG: glycosyltransferase family 4 protein [Chthoniobacterales bacterium]|nr:glycosyltransferase family 4 protein [Chthoniobacterales bacterium]